MRREIKSRLIVEDNVTERDPGASSPSRAPKAEEDEDTTRNSYPNYLNPSQPFVYNKERVMAPRLSESTYNSTPTRPPNSPLKSALGTPQVSSPFPDREGTEPLDISIPKYIAPAPRMPQTYQCPLCPKRFTRAYNLRSHLRTHD